MKQVQVFQLKTQQVFSNTSSNFRLSMANYLKEIESPSLTEMIVTMKFSNQLVLSQTINSLQ